MSHPKTPPRTAVLGPFHLSVLTSDCAEEDFAAVIASQERLTGLMGDDWPKGITWAQNHADLARHAQEFDEDIAYAWVIRDPAGGYLGCAYIKPSAEDRGRGVAYLWLQEGEHDPARLADLTQRLTDWMDGLGYDPAHFPLRAV